MTPDKKNVHELLNRYLPSPSTEEVETDGARVLQQLRSGAASSPAGSGTVPDFVPPSVKSWRFNPARVAAAFAAAALLSVLILQTVISPANVYAIVETVGGSLYRVTAGKSQAVKVGDRIESGTPVRTEGAGAVLKLPDGSRIEMHDKSELSLEQAADGVSIRLNDGSVSVTSAKQPAASLYVQNRDLTVPVIGTVFQSAQNATEPRLSFEVASVRPTEAAAGGQRGGGGGSPRPLEEPCGNPRGSSPASSLFIQVDGRRFAAHDMTLHALTLMAYGLDCTIWRGSETVLGGPGWAKTAGFDIQAVIPEGTPVYTKLQFLDHQAPQLQRMLQDLLAERFKLVLRRENREIPALVLTVASGGSKLTSWKPGDPTTINEWQQKSGLVLSEREAAQRAAELGQQDRTWFMGFKTPWSVFLSQLKSATDRPVIDRTGISSGEYNFAFQYTRGLPPSSYLLLPPSTGVPTYTPSAPSLIVVFEQELGLKLEPSRVPMDVLVIDRAERPSEN